MLSEAQREHKNLNQSNWMYKQASKMVYLNCRWMTYTHSIHVSCTITNAHAHTHSRTNSQAQAHTHTHTHVAPHDHQHTYTRNGTSRPKTLLPHPTVIKLTNAEHHTWKCHALPIGLESSVSLVCTMTGKQSRRRGRVGWGENNEWS